MVFVTVVICTYNRIKELESALRGIRNQTIKPLSIEIIVVDNACDVRVQHLVNRLSSTMPNLAYVAEPTVGLSFARNRGADEAKGEWIVYLDDDAIPDKDWLKYMQVCFNKFPQAGVIGGTILPVWPDNRPSWLTADLFQYLGVISYKGDSDGFELNFPNEYLGGGNIAYRKDLLWKFGGFNPRLGRRGDLLLAGEETALNFKLQAAGHQIWYCPRAIVYHQIFPSYLNKKFLRLKSYWSGRTKALLQAEIFGADYLRKALIRRIALEISIDFARYIYFGVFVRRNPFLTEVHFREFFGYFVQALQILRGKDLLA